MSHKAQHLGDPSHTNMKPHSFSLASHHLEYLYLQKKQRKVSLSVALREALESHMLAQGFVWEGCHDEQA